MIISKAPLRISFLGGTSDYPGFFMNSDTPGRVLGTTIDKFVYVNILNQPRFESIRYRFSWRYTESVSTLSEINHPVLRNVLERSEWQIPLNISTMATLPGRSGLGSSSAFTVALLGAMAKLKNSNYENAEALASEAIQIERFNLQEPGGWQDQYHSAIGGFRMYEFHKNSINYSEPVGSAILRDAISEYLVLIATGGGRDSWKYAASTTSNIQKKIYAEHLVKLSKLVEYTFNEISISNSVETVMAALAEGMREGWSLKKRISQHSNDNVDEILKYGIEKGALAGKLCGAGGSGFAAFIVKPKDMKKFQSNFNENKVVSVKVWNQGQEVFEI